MRLIGAVVNLGLVLHVARSAPSNSSRKDTTDVSNNVASAHYPVLWNRFIGTLMAQQDVSTSYCCLLPAQLRSCTCCAPLCRSVYAPSLPPPIIVPIFQPFLPPSSDSCCHLPRPLQDCGCCPDACKITLPGWCNQILSIRGCCNLPKPFISCECCPDACHWPIVPSNMSCCHLPEYLRTCDCCALDCQLPPPPGPEECCLWPNELQECSCCPTACDDDPDDYSCCYLPESEQLCECCPYACHPRTTTEVVPTTPIFDCCHLPVELQECECCPESCETHPTHKPTIVPTLTPYNCCFLPKEFQNCSCCPSACQQTTSMPDFTTILPTTEWDCCHVPQQFQDCDCCPSACVTSTTEKIQTETTFSCCNLPKVLQRCECCPEACQTTTMSSNCCHLPKELQECSCCPSACKDVTSTIAPIDCCHKPPEEQDCSCCPSACEGSTTEVSSTEISTSKESTTTELLSTLHSCCHLPKKYQNCRCCPSGCTESTPSITTLVPTTSLNCCHMPKWFQNCDCCPSLCDSTSSIETSTTTPSTTTTSFDCCDLPEELQSCSCCPSACLTSRSTFTTERGTTDGKTTMYPDDNKTTTTTEISTTKSHSSSTEPWWTSKPDTTLTTPSFDCCYLPLEFQSCSCCPSSCREPPIIPDINCCNWPKHLQTCACCASICPDFSITPDQTSCCFLPLSMQNCLCCTTSYNCRNPLIEEMLEPIENCCNLPKDKQNCSCCPTQCSYEVVKMDIPPLVYQEMFYLAENGNENPSATKGVQRNHKPIYFKPKLFTFLGRSLKVPFNKMTLQDLLPSLGSRRSSDNIDDGNAYKLENVGSSSTGHPEYNTSRRLVSDTGISINPFGPDYKSGARDIPYPGYSLIPFHDDNISIDNDKTLSNDRGYPSSQLHNDHISTNETEEPSYDRGHSSPSFHDYHLSNVSDDDTPNDSRYYHHLTTVSDDDAPNDPDYYHHLSIGSDDDAPNDSQYYHHLTTVSDDDAPNDSQHYHHLSTGSDDYQPNDSQHSSLPFDDDYVSIENNEESPDDFEYYDDISTNKNEKSPNNSVAVPVHNDHIATHKNEEPTNKLGSSALPFYDSTLSVDKDQIRSGANIGSTIYDITTEKSLVTLPSNSLILEKLNKLVKTLASNIGKTDCNNTKDSNHVFLQPYIYTGSGNMHNILISPTALNADPIEVDTLGDVEKLDDNLAYKIKSDFDSNEKFRYFRPTINYYNPYDSGLFQSNISPPPYKVSRIQLLKLLPRKNFKGLRNYKKAESSPFKIRIAIIPKQKSKTTNSSNTSDLLTEPMATVKKTYVSDLSDYEYTDTETELTRVKKSKSSKNRKGLNKKKTAPNARRKSLKGIKLRQNEHELTTLGPILSTQQQNRSGIDQSLMETTPFPRSILTTTFTRRWPIVYGTMGAVHLTAPKTSEKNNTTETVVSTPPPCIPQDDSGDDKTFLPVVIVIPQIVPFHNPQFAPYLHSPLSFPREYCLFDKFHPLCKQLLMPPPPNVQNEKDWSHSQQFHKPPYDNSKIESAESQSQYDPERESESVAEFEPDEEFVFASDDELAFDSEGDPVPDSAEGEFVSEEESEQYDPDNETAESECQPGREVDMENELNDDPGAEEEHEDDDWKLDTEEQRNNFQALGQDSCINVDKDTTDESDDPGSISVGYRAKHRVNLAAAKT